MIRRRTRRHATRPTGAPAHDPATGYPARNEPHSTRSGDGPFPHATNPTARDPATGHSRRDGPYGTRSGDGPFSPRRAVRHAIRRWTRRYATIISCLEMPGNVRKCPEYVWLFVVMSDYPVCSARCVGMRAAQRRASVAPLATSIDRHERRHATMFQDRAQVRAAPAASTARNVGRQIGVFRSENIFYFISLSV